MYTRKQGDRSHCLPLYTLYIHGLQFPCRFTGNPSGKTTTQNVLYDIKTGTRLNLTGTNDEYDIAVWVTVNVIPSVQCQKAANKDTTPALGVTSRYSMLAVPVWETLSLITTTSNRSPQAAV